MLTNGNIDLTNAKEATALPSNTDVASFSDSNHTDTASSFTATIDWGDGTVTDGTVVPTTVAGNFIVEGGHTYPDENFFTGIVTVTRTADNSQLVIAGTIPVADIDSISPHAATLTYTTNTPLTDVTVGTFTDGNTANVAGDFTAQIDWGDTTTSTGTVQGSNGSFSVVGSHTYTTSGEHTISVEVADDSPDAATGTITSTAVSGFGGQVTLNAATEGTALSSAQVATFADTTGSHAATDYTATIDWGDGSTSSGTVSGSGQSFTVTGNHTYADEEANESTGDGTSPIMTVTITRTSDAVTITPSGTVDVADADFLTSGPSKTIAGSPNQSLTSVTVLTFSDSYLGQIASDLPATIDWGDGSDPDTGTVSGSGGSFTVTGTHTYTADGQYNITVGIADDVPSPTQIHTFAATAIIGVAAGKFLLDGVAEGNGSSQNVATFGDSNSSDTAADFTASIDWGDGTLTGGTISGGSGSFTVSGIHPYADEGDEPLAVTFTRSADHDTATVTGTTTVGEDDSFVVSADNFNGDPGTAINNVQVATFTDAFTGQVASDLDVTINWGDGTSSAGTVSGGGGSFTVDGSHTYAKGGNYTFNVSVADDPPGTAAANANGSATINLSGHMVFTSATEALAVPNGTPIATFSDSNGGDSASSFSATIDWGDGTSSAGTVSGGAGTFTVSGGHTYADEGNDQASVTLTRTSDQAMSTVGGAVSVAENDALAGHGTTFSIHAHQSFSGTVATFTDTDTANVAGDFIATIDWGDGTTTAGTVAGSSGAFTVSGSHAYAAAGQDTVTVTLADDAPGTASAMATTTATVGAALNVKNDFDADGKSDLLLQNAAFTGNPNVMIEFLNGTTIVGSGTIPTPAGWHVEASADFNHDAKSDIILQNNDGLPEIWLMNGASVTSTVTLPNPGASWHVIAAADFNNDGNPDILWQNDDGQPIVWLMNGTTPVGGGPAPFNPGATWRAIGAGDFNGDGKADILWQNTDGQPDIWFMNGTNVIGGGAPLNPGASWHAIGVGDFNGDGHADILWQNADGQPDIWFMNGANVIGGGALAFNPGASWHAIGTSDFNGDGKADIVWQNIDGTPDIWLMNGTTVIGGGSIANPGATWQVKADGPIAPDQMTLGAQPAGLQSSPLFMAGAGPIGGPSEQTGVRQIFAGAGTGTG